MATPIPVNRCEFTLAEVATATGGMLLDGADPNATIRGVLTDTRVLEPGALFVALIGENHDGHTHLAGAIERGASAVLVRRGTMASVPRIEVDDTLVALGRLARFHVDRVRASRPVPSIAITGSAGKTTTKELTAAVVRAFYGKTLATVGNLNNLIGVPMTLLTLDATHRAMVIECGTNARGEIARLGEIVAPDVGIVLNADAGHTLGLGSIDEVAVEKGAMFEAARKRSVANRDDPVSFAQSTRSRGAGTLTFGEAEDATVRLLSRTFDRDGRCTVTLGLLPSSVRPPADPRFEITLALPGKAAALDAAAAVAGILALGDDRKLGVDDLDVIRAALASVQPTAGRMQPIRAGDVTVIDDSYNANPRSVRASLATAREMADGVGGRLIVVLGDMLELGSLSQGLHAAVGSDVVSVAPAVFVTVGPEMAYAARVAAARAGEGAAAIVVETQATDDAANVVQSILHSGDVVLVKGSRGMRMERVVEALAGAAQASRAARAEGPT